jgi:hypothetical protein
MYPVGVIKQRLLKKRVIDVSGCWLWTGYINDSGYGILSTDYKKYERVHRISFQLFRPAEYKEYLLVCHKCNVRNCFNPDHLYMGTEATNHQDSIKAGTSKLLIGSSKPEFCKKGHLFTEENTYITPSTGRRMCKICIKTRSSLQFMKGIL